ncbi:MAG: YitT family protein [Erysipelotrichia bacterium]|nr:YitT family protein [Erysipelotrichia bacterium]NCC54321.1 YitT family protein [Erysipelotrichia bacterium]
MEFKLSRNLQAWLLVVVGSFLFCVGLNLFITPMNLYTGGIVGLSQMIRTLFNEWGLQLGEIAGYINMAFNLPLLFIAYKSISKRFFVLTITSILLQTLFFALIPIPVQPIIDDLLTSVIVGGIIAGFGIGLVLRSSGSAGGTDILGVYFTKKISHFSVGKLNIIFNIILFSICMIIFNVETAVYSILNIVIFSFVLDKVHYQNISVTAMIFTKSLEAQKYIMVDLHRGITYWKGLGAYTNEETYVMITAISKYEVNELRLEILKADPNAFIIFSEGLSISGNFEKHL